MDDESGESMEPMEEGSIDSPLSSSITPSLFHSRLNVRSKAVLALEHNLH